GADPPGGIAGEANPPVRIVFLDGAHEPEATLLDQVGQERRSRAALPGNLRHQPEVALHQGSGDGRIARLAIAAGEPRLFLAAQQRCVLEGPTEMHASDTLRARRIHAWAVFKSRARPC